MFVSLSPLPAPIQWFQWWDINIDFWIANFQTLSLSQKLRIKFIELFIILFHRPSNIFNGYWDSECFSSGRSLQPCPVFNIPKALQRFRFSSIIITKWCRRQGVPSQTKSYLSISCHANVQSSDHVAFWQTQLVGIVPSD